MIEVKNEKIKVIFNNSVNLEVDWKTEKITLKEDDKELDIKQLYGWLASIGIPIEVDQITFGYLTMWVFFEGRALVVSIEGVGTIEYLPQKHLEVRKNNEPLLMVEFPQ